MSDILQRLDNLAGDGEWCSPLAQEAAARVRELEDELRIGRQASEIVGRMATQQLERVRELEAERGPILEIGREFKERAERAEAENERLRALLDMARREQCQCRTCRAIRAALAQGEKP